MKGWTSRLWRSWRATGTPLFWSAHTVTPQMKLKQEAAEKLEEALFRF